MEKECPSCLMMIPYEATVCPCCKKKFAYKINVSGDTIKKVVSAAIVLSVLLSLAFIFRYDEEYIQGPLYRYDRFTSTVEVRRSEGSGFTWVSIPRFKNLQHVRDVRTRQAVEDQNEGVKQELEDLKNKMERDKSERESKARSESAEREYKERMEKFQKDTDERIRQQREEFRRRMDANRRS